MDSRGGMEGVVRSLSNSSLFARMEKKMFSMETVVGFIIGAVSATCLALIVALATVLAKMKSTKKGLLQSFGELQSEVVSEMNRLGIKIAQLPVPITNVIHLGLKDGRATTDLLPINLKIKPEDFVLNKVKVLSRLIYGLEKKRQIFADQPETRAYLILDNAGLIHVFDSNSRSEVQKALTRLLINEDDEATKRFLETLAESICHVSELEVVTETT